MEHNDYKKILKSGTLLALTAVLLFKIGKPEEKQKLDISTPRTYNPCCEYPCENNAVCVNFANNTYYCECPDGFSGLNCQLPNWSRWLVYMIKPSPDTLHHLLTHYPAVWGLVNRIPFIQRRLMRYVYLSRGDMVDSPPVYESEHHYITLDAYYNETYFSRTLPPVPLECPTPMGVKGPKELPSTAELFKRIFLRKKFKPEPHGSNLLFQYFAQHFTHQFFRTDYSKIFITKGKGGVDASNIYGITEEIRQGLRAHVDGKLLTQKLAGEDFPPFLKDVEGISMDYPPHIPIPESGKFALGHPFFALLPGLFVYATIWMREHNRVCDLLKNEHPHWDDDRLYHTARLVVVGEIIKITVEDYVQHLSQYKVKLTFDPEMAHGTHFQYHNRIHAEFDQLYHWHPLVPNGIQVNNTYYRLMDMAFSTAAVFKHGLDNFIHAMATSRAGAMTVRNHVNVVEPVLSKAFNNTRKMRFQSFNQYRKRFGLHPYRSFEELTGEKEVAKELEDLYGDVDAVEFYVGLFAEAQGPSLTGISMVNMGGPYSVKGLISNPICSLGWWKPSTFGGATGFNIVNSASLEKLFCNNMKTSCKHISFKVPIETSWDDPTPGPDSGAP